MSWLGLDPQEALPSSHVLTRMHERQYPRASLPASLLQQMKAFYAPQNERLFGLLQGWGYGALVKQLRSTWPRELDATMQELADVGGPRAPAVAAAAV